MRNIFLKKIIIIERKKEMDIDEKVRIYKEKQEKEMLKMQAVIDMVERLQNLYGWYTYNEYITDENGERVTDENGVALFEKKFYNDDDEYKWFIVQKTIENLMK